MHEQSQREIRVMIVEDHPLFAQGLKHILGNEDDIEVVAEACNGQEAVELASSLKLDVILMDVNMPIKNGFEAAKEISASETMGIPKIMILSAHYDDQQLLHALYSGASAYYSKDIDPVDLVKAVRGVASGQYSVQDKLMSRPHAFQWLIKQFNSQASGGVFDDPTADSISARELEILSYIIRGASNKEIANLLGISVRTVKNHLYRLFKKLDVEDRTQAAVLALRRGWVRDNLTH